MITDETIDLTIIELARTMRALKALKAARKKPGQTWGGHTYPPTEVKEHAAAKRASMDLTRMLANLRAGR